MASSMSFNLSCLLSLLKHLREGSFSNIDDNSDRCFSAMFALALFFKLKMNLIDIFVPMDTWVFDEGIRLLDWVAAGLLVTSA